MGYFEIGLTVGYLIYGIFLLGLMFSTNLNKWFYLELLSDTLLGNTGQFLYFPEEVDIEEGTIGRRIIVTGIHISLHILIFAIWSIIFLLMGALLAPFILLGIIFGPFVYLFSKRKSKKLE